MTATMPREQGEDSGFHGEVAGLSLADVLQLNGQSRFSGCITVSDGARTGLVFFRDGEIVHAEQGRRSGEEAFYDVMDWSSGTFALERNVSTTVRTIHKSVEHLLIEASRVLDERRAGRAPAPQPAPTPAPLQRQPTMVERLRAVPGIAQATFMRTDGACTDDGGCEAEALAGRAAFLGMLGNQLGALLGLGPLRSAVLHGTPAHREHVVLLGARTHYLTLLVRDAEVSGVEASVRKLLGSAP
jgi:hypothetical protein